VEVEGDGIAVRVVAVAERGLGGGAEEIGFHQADGKRHLTARAAEPPVQLGAPTVLGEYPEHQAGIGSHCIDLDPPEDPERAEVPLRFGGESRVVGLAGPQQYLAPDDGRTGLEVQLIGQPGKPAALVRVEDIPPLQLDPVNDQSRIDGSCVRGALGSQLQGTEQNRNRQKVPKKQQNSIEKAAERAGR
jgi:hypothetical protein